MQVLIMEETMKALKIMLVIFWTTALATSPALSSSCEGSYDSKGNCIGCQGNSCS